MKVSEAVYVIQSHSGAWHAGTQFGAAIQTLLASHEALRLAGEAVSEEPYNPSGIADLGTIVVSRKEYDALSLAVEDASK